MLKIYIVILLASHSTAENRQSFQQMVVSSRSGSDYQPQMSGYVYKRETGVPDKMFRLSNSHDPQRERLKPAHSIKQDIYRRPPQYAQRYVPASEVPAPVHENIDDEPDYIPEVSLSHQDNFEKQKPFRNTDHFIDSSDKYSNSKFADYDNINNDPKGDELFFEGLKDDFNQYYSDFNNNYDIAQHRGLSDAEMRDYNFYRNIPHIDDKHTYGADTYYSHDYTPPSFYEQESLAETPSNTDSSFEDFGSHLKNTLENVYKSGYDKTNEFDKHETGDEQAINEGVDYELDFDLNKNFSDFVDRFNGKFEAKKAQHKGSYEVQGNRNKGHRRKGSHRVYHKDEYIDDKDFYDDADLKTKYAEGGDLDSIYKLVNSAKRKKIEDIKGNDASKYNVAGTISNKHFDKDVTANENKKGESVYS